MITKPGVSLYRLNLIRDLRVKELKSEKRKRLTVILGLGCFGFFLLSLLYSVLTIWQMERVLVREKDKLQRLRLEYQKYTAARMIVDKSDIELLNDLQGKGIFWSKKLASIAKHLPENYSITGFNYKDNELKISGFGLASSHQDQLLVLDQYLNQLRFDSTFSTTFPILQLNNADRKEESGHIGFGFSAYNAKWKAQ